MNRNKINKKSICINDKLLYQYLEGETSGRMKLRIESHLNACDKCFFEMTSLIKNTSTPISKIEKEQIDAMMNYTKEEQVVKILSYYHNLNMPLSNRLLSWMKSNIKKIIQHIKTFIASVVPNMRITRPAVVIVIALVFIFYGNRYYHTDYQLNEAGKLLKNNHKIFIENVRLSGGFNAKGTSDILDVDSKKLPYLEQAKHRLNIAIEHNAKFNEAIYQLAQIYIIENKFDKAEPMLMELLDQNKSASILNDLGTIYYSKGVLDKAAQYFENAFQIDANFVEAYYNLALTKIKSGALEEATLFLNKAIELEKNEAWNAAAQRLRQQIEANE